MRTKDQWGRDNSGSGESRRVKARCVTMTWGQYSLGDEDLGSTGSRELKFTGSR